MPDKPRSIGNAPSVASAKPVRNVWATAGCVLAFGFFLPPLAIAGTVVSWIGLRRSASRAIGGRRAALVGLSLGLLGLVLAPVEFVALHWAGEKADQLKCQSQMSAIAQAVFMYANNYHGQLPPDLSAVAVEEDITPAAFVCLDSSDTPAASSAGVAAPGHLSYFYLRAGRRLSDIKSPQSTVMLYEFPNHLGGMNVAFYDGHMEFMTGRRASQVRAELSSGRNPPPAVIGP